MQGTPKNLKDAIKQGFQRYMADATKNGQDAALNSIGQSVMEFLNNRVGAIQMHFETGVESQEDQQEKTFKEVQELFDQFFKDVKI